MRDFISRMFSAGDDVSSKRVIGFMTFILMGIMAMVDQFTKFEASEYIFDSFMYLLLGVFAAGAVEVFGRRTGRSSATTVHVDKATVQVKEDKPISLVDTLPTKPTQELEENEIIG